MTSREIINADTGQREVWDFAAGTYTRTVGGVVAETRALTSAELATRPVDPAPSDAEKLAALLAALADAETLGDVRAAAEAAAGGA